MNYHLLIEIAGFTIGLLYLWWEYHANPKMWIASVIMPAISMWIYFSKGLYADFSINIYYLLIAVYGYVRWTRGSADKDKNIGVPITHITFRAALGCLVVFSLLWTGFYFGLTSLTDSNVPLGDSFTTALSIVAMWMLARKYAEQWLAWMLVDLVCVYLYIYKGIYFYGTLYSIYTVIAVLGYQKWLRKMRG